MGESHGHMGESVESLSASSLILLLQLFSIVLDVRHLPRIVVLIQYAWENLIRMEESHENGRTS